MLFSNVKKKTIFFTTILLLVILGFLSAHNKVIELKFAQPPVSDSDESRTLRNPTQKLVQPKI